MEIVDHIVNQGPILTFLSEFTDVRALDKQKRG